MVKDRHNTLRSNKIIKVTSYIEFKNEIMRLKEEGHDLVLNGRDLYVDGKLGVMWIHGQQGRSVKLVSFRTSEETYNGLHQLADHIGCSIAELYDYFVQTALDKGGIKSIAEECKIKSFEGSQKKVGKALDRIERIKGAENTEK